MAGTVKVIGLKELGDAMNLVPQNFERRVMAGATRAGGRVLEEAVRARAPVDTGELRREVDAKFRVIPKSKIGLGIGLAVIGVIYRGIRAKVGRHGKAPSTEDPGVYAFFLERGTSKMAARPFMRPAFDESSDAAVAAFADNVRSRLGDLVG